MGALGGWPAGPVPDLNGGSQSGAELGWGGEAMGKWGGRPIRERASWE